MTIGRKVDQTGRSNGTLSFTGRAKRWKLEGAFIAHPRALLESPGWAAMTGPARRVLDFIELEHLKHGGAENGRLLAPHAQLRAGGISGRDVKRALEMLEAFGIIHRTDAGERLAARPRAAMYALTWYPTADGELPTEAFRNVTRADIEAYLQGATVARNAKAQRKMARLAA